MRAALACLCCAVLAVATVGCECSTSSQDRDEHFAEMRRLDNHYHWMMAPRPQPKGFGCEVCPDWCTVLKLEVHPAPRLMAAYRRAAMQHSYTDRYGKGWQQAEGIACIVKAAGPALMAEFVTLLHDPDPAVRYCAAVHAIQYDMAVDAAVATLRDLVAHGDERWRQSAIMQLGQWEGGAEVEL